MLDIQKLERKKKDKTYTSFMHHYKTTFPSMQCYTNTVLLHRSTTKIYSTTITIKFTKKNELDPQLHIYLRPKTSLSVYKTLVTDGAGESENAASSSI